MSRIYSAEMRAKWKTLISLILVVVAVVVLLFRHAGPDDQLSFGWAALGLATLVGGSIVGYRVLGCPACSERLGSLQDKVCRHCGAILTDEAIKPPSSGGPRPEIAAYMAESERILRRWSAVRGRLRHAPWVLGILTAVGVAVAFQMAPVPHGIGEGVGIGAVVGLMVAGIAWLALVSVVDNMFGSIFSLWRGRCPACRAWFTHSTVVVPNVMIVDYSLPAICPACGEKLR